MEHEIKAQVLKEIMKAMLDRDGQSLRPKPKAVSVEVEEMKPEMSCEEDGMSPDDADILSKLYSEGEGEPPQEEEDEEEEAALV